MTPEETKHREYTVIRVRAYGELSATNRSLFSQPISSESNRMIHILLMYSSSRWSWRVTTALSMPQ